jgi:beta-1,2-mannobiose phosphorylase / 1,2-beta-oligomannan phosphorylase
MTSSVSTDVGYRLTRLGVIMRADPASDLEAEGVLNPASGRTPDGRLWLLPRLVAKGNVSRVGLAEVIIDDGQPVGARREGVVLEPDAGWERSHEHAGVEDPRATWIASLGVHVMTYVAFGPLGPKPALAVSHDLRRWRRLGPLHFDYQPDLDADLNLFANKDVVWFPEPVPGPDGQLAYAVVHRPMWDLGFTRGGGHEVVMPAGTTDPRPGMWISYVPVEAVKRDLAALTHVRWHRPLALPHYDWETLRIGAGPPPLRVEQGWLLIHHGVSGRLSEGFVRQRHAHYSAGAMLLDPANPSLVLARTAEPLLSPETADELSGTVPNVVFPTAIEEIDGQQFVFYGMADSSIGVDRLDDVRTP